MIHARDDYAPIQDPRSKIPEGEPVMLIRGQDQAAVPAMRAWIDAHLEAGGSEVLADLIHDQIDRVLDWQAEHACKVADL